MIRVRVRVRVRIRFRVRVRVRVRVSNLDEIEEENYVTLRDVILFFNFIKFTIPIPYPNPNPIPNPNPNPNPNRSPNPSSNPSPNPNPNPNQYATASPLAAVSAGSCSRVPHLPRAKTADVIACRAGWGGSARDIGEM